MEQVGHQLCASPLLASGIVAATALRLAGSQAQQAAWLPKIARGECIATLAVDESAKHRPAPIDGYFGAVYYVGPIFSAFRGTQDCVDYYRELRSELKARGHTLRTHSDIETLVHLYEDEGEEGNAAPAA